MDFSGDKRTRFTGRLILLEDSELLEGKSGDIIVLSLNLLDRLKEFAIINESNSHATYTFCPVDELLKHLNSIKFKGV